MRQIAASLAALLLAACAGSDMDRLLGKTPAPEGAARTAYAAVDRAKVFSHPDASASVLGVLKLRERLARYQSENGFAWVEAEGNLSGWVRESELAEAPPRARKAAPPEPARAPAPAPPEEPAAEPAEPAGTEPEEEETPGEPLEPERSVFDPY
jgi:hypothetical protein